MTATKRLGWLNVLVSKHHVYASNRNRRRHDAHYAVSSYSSGEGRICMSNNAAERAVRGVAVGRKNWTFCGSDSGGYRAAAIYTLIETCKLCGVDPHAWLADVLARLPDHPAKRITELLPWNWKAARAAAAPAR